MATENSQALLTFAAIERLRSRGAAITPQTVEEELRVAGGSTVARQLTAMVPKPDLAAAITASRAASAGTSVTAQPPEPQAPLRSAQVAETVASPSTNSLAAAIKARREN